MLLHCVHAQSRTPTLAALYGARRTGRSAAETLTDVLRARPTADPNSPALGDVDYWTVGSCVAGFPIALIRGRVGS
ncbi:MAG: hypothetical protein ACT4P1_03185 [Sporichthyaceae bacterium]